MAHRTARHGFAAAFLGLLLAASASADPRTKIDFILADDLDQALAKKVPIVKSLIANQGIKFDKHYVSLSLRCPSRVTSLRGQFAHNTKIFTNNENGGFIKTHQDGLQDSTAATWL